MPFDAIWEKNLYRKAVAPLFEFSRSAFTTPRSCYLQSPTVDSATGTAKEFVGVEPLDSKTGAGVAVTSVPSAIEWDPPAAPAFTREDVVPPDASFSGREIHACLEVKRDGGLRDGTGE